MSEGNQSRRRGRGVALTLALTLSLANVAGAAELLVIESTVPGLQAGATASTGAPLEVPRDSDLTLVAPSGGVLTIQGPWQGQIEAPAARGDEGLIGRLLSVFQAPEADTSLGAMRSFSDCELVELGRMADVCVPASGCIEIRTAGEIPRLLAAHAPDGSEAELARTMGGEIWAWPRGHQVQDGEYVLTSSGGGAEVLRVHVQPPLASTAHEIAWMSEAGCLAQAKTALNELTR